MKSYLYYCIILLCVSAWNSQELSAQVLQSGHGKNPPVATEAKPLQNLKRDTLYKDPKTGRWMEVISYEEDGMKVTQSRFVPPPVGANEPINMNQIDLDSIVIVIEKEENLLSILHKKKRIRQYRAVFGPDKFTDKHREGDRCTPEGWFKILQVRDHASWQKFMLIDYPNEESYKKFNDRKAKGIIPKNATIGFAIGIHGTFKGGDKMVEMGIGWTDGCIALSSKDIMDLYKFVKPGTKVFIRKKGKQNINN